MSETLLTTKEAMRLLLTHSFNIYNAIKRGDLISTGTSRTAPGQPHITADRLRAYQAKLQRPPVTHATGGRTLGGDVLSRSTLTRLTAIIAELADATTAYQLLAASTIAKALDDIHGITVGKPPTPDEVASAQAWLQTTGAHWLELLGADPERAAQLLATVPGRVAERREA